MLVVRPAVLKVETEREKELSQQLDNLRLEMKYHDSKILT